MGRGGHQQQGDGQRGIKGIVKLPPPLPRASTGNSIVQPHLRHHHLGTVVGPTPGALPQGEERGHQCHRSWVPRVRPEVGPDLDGEAHRGRRRQLVLVPQRFEDGPRPGRQARPGRAHSAPLEARCRGQRPRAEARVAMEPAEEGAGGRVGKGAAQAVWTQVVHGR